jgi:hypothetical protein
MEVFGVVGHVGDGGVDGQALEEFSAAQNLAVTLDRRAGCRNRYGSVYVTRCG